MPRPAVVVVVLLAAVGGCTAAPSSPATGSRPAPAASPTALATEGPRQDAVRVEPATRRVVFLGDSLTAGLGLPADQSFPALIASRLEARRMGWTVVNAGVSGDTSAGGRRRLDWSLDGGAQILVVALGANDALRGLPPADLERNLDAIVTTAAARGVRVLLAGMEAPPNNGPEYTGRFRQVYADVARRHGVTLLPFLLDGVAAVESLNQADGIHPNQAGALRVAALVWTALEPLVHAVESAPTE